jgi:hypothetical protein
MRALRNRRKPLGLILSCLAAIALSGCANGKPVVLTAPTLCKDWPVMTRSKDDKITTQTAATMAASNAARPEYGCHPDKNEAQGS